ncbi:MAG TPA: type II toxin-antitoxin system HicA family toxin [Anaerolineae bacterium]|nr:type II toxin-antitoxin system HicA family toxin [Anaerolineae bacterium]HMR67328.1 type II toxin-antitoxin system HicA family toxin [Anaerolineae bacterium]
MKAISGKKFAQLLEKRDWELKRVKGSHHVYMKPGNPARISVPIHGNTPLKIGLLRHLMKLADINEDEL